MLVDPTARIARQFQSIGAFPPANTGYTLLPFRFARLPKRPGEVLLTSETGEYIFVPDRLVKPLVDGTLPRSTPCYQDLISKSFIVEAGLSTTIRRLASQYRSRKSYLFDGPSLFIFVVTLRCDHSCHYCQVSRRSVDASAFDMSEATARAAIDRVFEAPSKEVTIEFQGGEPLLAFPTIRKIVEEIRRRTAASDKRVSFSIATTLHHATAEILAFFKEHSFAVSTSLDGTADVHNRHRPIPTGDSHAKTQASLSRARAVLGANAVSALTTITRTALEHPEQLIDSYVEAGFSSIFLRPLAPFGFAARAERKLGYPMSDFVRFYERALRYIIKISAKGRAFSETYASLLLTHILTPYSTGYVDLRSPSGAGLGALVFNYDGFVYPSDEARMLVETGDRSLQLGHVSSAYAELMTSPVLRMLVESSVSESLPGCSDCAFVPYCGADPVAFIGTRGEPIGYTLSSAHCERHMGIFNVLFDHLAEARPDTMRLFSSWLLPRRT